MKKIFIVTGILLLITAIVITAVLLTGNNKEDTAPAVTEDITEAAETVINVDGWLKITKIFEIDGRLALIAKNISDRDIEYSVLTVNDKNDTFSFNISAMLRNKEMMLICNEAAGFNPDTVYTGWKTENIIYFEETPVMHDDKYEVRVTEGSISVNNISGEDITSDILIYYKELIDGIPIGSTTHRIRVSGIKADSLTYVNAEGLNESNCQILFTQY